jgi:hypothetical protein
MQSVSPNLKNIYFIFSNVENKNYGSILTFCAPSSSNRYLVLIHFLSNEVDSGIQELDRQLRKLRCKQWIGGGGRGKTYLYNYYR